MKKIGATFRDKNRVKLLHEQGHSPARIAQLTYLKEEHVEAILEQLEEGTLVLNAGSMVTLSSSEEDAA